MRTAILINTHSRQASKLLERVIVQLPKKLKDHDIVSMIIIHDTEKFDSCLEKLRSIANLECVIVGSGDGTIVAVLNALKDRKNLMYGFLPLGTSNTFVRSLGLPLTYDKAVKVIEGGYIRPVSLGSINNYLFANIAGLGVPVRVVQYMSNRTKRLFGPMSYAFSGLRHLIRHKSFYCQIKSDDSTESFYTHHLLIANGPYHGPIHLSSEASAFNNQLVVVSFGTNQTSWGYFKNLLRFGIGRKANDPATRIFPITKARLITEPRRLIEADGEMIGKTPADIEVVKEAIKVFTPIEAPDQLRKRHSIRR